MVQAQKVGFEGIKGSHSEEAVLQLYKSQPAFSNQSPQPTGFSTFDQVCRAVLNGTVDFGLVPIENSIAGSFFPVIDLIVSNQLHIIGEFEQEERHIVAALPGTKLHDIKEVHSHPYSFDQCRPFLGTLEGKKLVQSLDTAASCENIQKNKLTGVAAIASPKAASIYGLEVIYEIDTVAVTRYALVSKSPVIPERHLNPRTSVQVILKNQVGAMLKAISAFSLRDISIAKIESRPSSRSIKLLKPWEYVVYIDLETGTNDARLKNALSNLQEFATVTVLGSYPRFQQPSEPATFSYGV